MKRCFSCSNLVAVDKPGRTETCLNCGADLKCCRNCRFYDERSYNSCSEPSAERVLEKSRSNFCEFFEFRDSLAAGNEKEEALRKLRDLFKS